VLAGTPLIAQLAQGTKDYMRTNANVRKLLVMAIAAWGASTLEAPASRAAGFDYKIEGTYAVHSTIGPNMGSAIGVYKVDHAGKFYGYADLNIPNSIGGRVTAHLTISNGTITYNADGITGTASYDGTPTGGTPIHVDEDFVITHVKDRAGRKVVMELFDQRQQASVLVAGSYEVTIVWNRLPEEE
jgi:hypothetical protein